MTADELSAGGESDVPGESGGSSGGLGTLSSGGGCCADSFLRQSSHPFVALFHLLFKVRGRASLHVALRVDAMRGFEQFLTMFVVCRQRRLCCIFSWVGLRMAS